MTNDGRGKFAVSGWKKGGPIAPAAGGEKNRFRLDKKVAQDMQEESLEQSTAVPDILEVSDQLPANLEPTALNEPALLDGAHDIPEDLVAVSISTALQGVSHTYEPLNIATLHSLGSPTSIRLVKLSGQSSWHTHEHTDEIFIILRGAIDMLYRSAGEEKVVRFIGGELLRVPMKLEHCVVADEGTEVILLEGRDGEV
jgi:mannose-6-phosphate isomerase-like protein (cupin superfamily)